jgi:surface protein
MPKLVNRAKMTTATTGTGTITLGSAVDGYQTFANAGVADADVVRYVIEDGSHWEIGTGTYTATGTTLARNPSESSNSGSPINLSGSAVVFVGATAEDFFKPPAPVEWVRNPSWPACEADAGDNKIVGLYAVWPGDGVGNGGNFFAMTISGDYTIDFGDGTTTNFTSGSTAYYEFDYNNANLAGTDAPVTFTASTDTVNRTAHGYSNGMIVRFYNIATTTGLDQGQTYYVINAADDSFQVSLTEGGSAVSLTNDGSASLLPYKIATVTITPQDANDLTNVNFFVKHNQTGLVNGYSTGWLDIAIAAPNCTALTIGSSATTVRYGYLERVRLNQIGSITTFERLFQFCRSLQSVVIADTITAVTNTSNMFNGCSALTSAPLFDTALVTNMSFMFSGCPSLTSVPLFDTALVTNTSNMFNGCSALTSVPLFDTASVTDMSFMFSGCPSLTSVPLFDTASVTNMSRMFSNCTSLISVPLFDTASVTDTSFMLSSCSSLTSVPLFNTASVANMSFMLGFCSSLASVPLFNTASVTNMSNMFNTCSSLTSVPLFNTALVTNMGSMFSNCSSLTSVPALVTTAVTAATGFSSIFNGCNSLARIEASDFRFTFSVANCKLSAAALDEIYTNLPTVSGQTITVSGNYGIAGDDPTIATAKGWTVTGS